MMKNVRKLLMLILILALGVTVVFSSTASAATDETAPVLTADLSFIPKTIAKGSKLDLKQVRNSIIAKDETDGDISARTVISVKKLNDEGEEASDVAVSDSSCTLNDIGKYRVILTVEDAAGNEAKLSKDLEVKTAIDTDTTKPTITVSGGPSSGKQTVEMTLPAAVVSDDMDDEVSVSVKVTEPEIKALTAERNAQNVITGYKFTPKRSGKYVFLYTAVDDQGNRETAELTVEVAADTTAPVISSATLGTVSINGNTVSNGQSGFAQGDVVTITNSTVVATDETSTATIGIMALDPDGFAADVKFVIDSSNTIRTATFTAAKAGEYQIILFAKDAAGNEKRDTNVFKFSTLDTEAPTITVTGMPSTVQPGETVVLPEPQFFDNVGIDEDTFRIEISGASSLVIDPETRKFTPDAVGKYTVRYYVEDVNGNAAWSMEYVITVADTEGPDLEISGHDGIADGDVLLQVEKDVESVSLPGASAADSVVGVLGDDYISVKVVDPNGVTVTVTGSASEGYSFKVPQSGGANKQGQYKATYSARDERANETSMTFIVKVGDGDAPVITLDEDAIPTKGTTNTVISLPVATATDNVDTSVTVVITITGPDGSLVTVSADGKFTPTLSGNYKVKYTATDTVGNKAETEEFTINVEAGTSTVEPVEDTPFPVWAIILIVVIIMGMGVLVVWMIVRKRKKCRQNKKPYSLKGFFCLFFKIQHIKEMAGKRKKLRKRGLKNRNRKMLAG